MLSVQLLVGPVQICSFISIFASWTKMEQVHQAQGCAKQNGWVGKYLFLKSSGCSRKAGFTEERWQMMANAERGTGAQAPTKSYSLCCGRHTTIPANPRAWLCFADQERHFGHSLRLHIDMSLGGNRLAGRHGKPAQIRCFPQWLSNHNWRQRQPNPTGTA